jgi:hypothetical protein
MAGGVSNGGAPAARPARAVRGGPRPPGRRRTSTSQLVARPVAEVGWLSRCISWTARGIARACPSSKMTSAPVGIPSENEGGGRKRGSWIIDFCSFSFFSEHIGEMKSYPSFSPSPRFTACVSCRRAFGGFARKPSDLLEIAKWSSTSLPHRKHVQNIFVKPLKLNFIFTGKSRNC